MCVDGISLWRVDLDAPTRRNADDWLSPSEQERAARFVFPRDARRYRAAHVALRCLLATHAGVPAHIEFEIGAHGKPGLGSAGACGFNLSHSGGTALIGLSACAGIGVDIEVLHPIDDIDALAERNFSVAEIKELQRIPAHQQQQAFLSGWTRKEACLKALGTGLSVEPGCFETGLAPQTLRLSIATELGPAGLWVQSLELGAGVLAAVANTISPHRHDAHIR